MIRASKFEYPSQSVPGAKFFRVVATNVVVDPLPLVVTDIRSPKFSATLVRITERVVVALDVSYF